MNKSMTFAVRATTISAVVALGFGTCAASAAALANGQPVSDGVKQYIVRFPDLDLSTMAGAAALYARLRHAARVVCDPLQSREMGIAAKYRACMDQTVADAVTRVNRPLVSEYHQWQTKGGRSGPVRLARAE